MHLTALALDFLLHVDIGFDIDIGFDFDILILAVTRKYPKDIFS